MNQERIQYKTCILAMQQIKPTHLAFRRIYSLIYIGLCSGKGIFRNMNRGPGPGVHFKCYFQSVQILEEKNFPFIINIGTFSLLKGARARPGSSRMLVDSSPEKKFKQVRNSFYTSEVTPDYSKSNLFLVSILSTI